MRCRAVYNRKRKWVHVDNWLNLKFNFGQGTAYDPALPTKEWTDPRFLTAEALKLWPPIDIAPAESGAAKTGVSLAPKYRVDGERRCREFLAGLMRGENPTKGQDKTALKDECVPKFLISGRGFDRAWDHALDDAKAHKTWGRPGARPNPIRNPRT